MMRKKWGKKVSHDMKKRGQTNEELTTYVSMEENLRLCNKVSENMINMWEL
jgi:hypothetical protein